ncbi:hypothetical protein [Streptomyces sp. TP-A0875]|uniref:hypothetical protein n=1 Tax=Streptomyces sp. TP-A0875 TaxID=552354 RepID=UPI0006B420F3|nr:hypothetical protein [Streptomyces sp. TP-A0875]
MSDAAAEPEGPADPPGRPPGTDGGADGREPAAPAPLGVPRTPTGHAAVDDRLRRLADADHLATEGHVEVYEDVHRGLREALAALDTRPGPPSPAPRPTTTPRPGPAGPAPGPPYAQGS